MRMKRLLGLLSLFSASAAGLAQTTAFTYQGNLAASGAAADGKFDLVFALFNTNSGGNQIGPALTNAATGVNNGLFTVVLNFGSGIFTGPTYWLQIGVRTNGSTGAFTTLAPLQEITPAPAAIVANSALSLAGALPSAELTGTYGSAVSFTNGANHFAGDGSALGGLWNIKGNSGTNPQSNNFVGTLDNQALELHVNGARALRLEPTTNSPNVIGGSSINAVAVGVYAATIGGGNSNAIESGAFDATIAGGATNDIGPGADASTITGGINNTIADSANESTIGGGNGNTIQISASDATIGGGASNTATGPGAAIAGGEFNTAGGFASVVPGGVGNSAGGDYSFAAGSSANATNDGAFVWADSLAFTFSSAADNEFAARATGGVRFVSAVDGNGNPTAGVQLAAGGGSWSSLSDRTSKENFTAVNTLDVLERLCAIRVSTWNYKTQPTATRHIGPMAQDFAQAFGVGEDNRHITGIDADGVALAAIQGLNEKLETALRQKDAELVRLKEKAAKVDLLEQRLNELEQALQSREPGR